MRKIKKSMIIGLCIGFILLFFFCAIQINTDAVLCRYLFPDDTFLILEGEEQIDVSLNIVLDGKRRVLRSFSSPDERNLYYFFLPAGSGREAVRLITNLDSEKWESPAADLARMEITREDEQCDLQIRVRDIRKQEDEEICIRFMESENQPSVFVDVEERLDNLLADRDLKVKGNICIYDKESVTLFSDKVNLKGHGNGSWSNNKKKSWLLDFGEPVSVLGMNKGYKYIAVANAQDQSYLRNKFVYDWAEEMGMAYSPQSVFGNFFVNGEYLGLYLFTEGIEASEDRIAVQQDESAQARAKSNALEYYECEDEKGYILPEGIRENENVGYLLRQEDNESRYDGMGCAFKTRNGGQIEIIYPRKASQKQIANIKQYIQEFQDAVESEDGYCDTPQGKKHYSEYIDMDSFLKKYLIEEISKNHDGNSGSSYFYMKAFGDNPILYEGPVWDYDIAFGNITYNAMWQEAEGMIKLNPGLDRREEFMVAAIQYYATYFRPYLETEAEQKIRGCAEEIRTSAQMDRVRWESENTFWNGSFDDGVEDLITFIRKRMQFLDDVWINGKVYYRVNFVNGDNTVKTAYVEKGKSLNDVMDTTYRLAEEGKSFVGWYDESMENTVDYGAQITDDMAYWAKWEE